MKTTRLIMLLSVVSIVALFLVACGGDDDETADGNAGIATFTTGADGDDDGSDDETAEPTEDSSDDGDDDSGDSEDAVDACLLITPDEAEAALGGSVGEGDRLDVAPVFSCTYSTEGFETVSISVVVFDNAEQAQAVYDLAIENNDYEEIDGTGDRGYFALGFGVTAQKDRYEVTVGITGPDDARPLEEDLARKAIDRLP